MNLDEHNLLTRKYLDLTNLMEELKEVYDDHQNTIRKGDTEHTPMPDGICVCRRCSMYREYKINESD